MEENFDITNILVSDRFKEASREACKRFPRYKFQVTYEGVLQGEIPCDYFPQQVIIKKHFYVDDKDVSEDEYNDVVKLTAYCLEARKIALDEAKLEILRDMESISDYTSEETMHPDSIPEDPNLIPEVSRFLKDNEEKMAHRDYIIEILKDGPKTSSELRKRIYNSRKVYGPPVTSLLLKLEDDCIIKRICGNKSKEFKYRLTPFWEIMYSAMKE